MRIKANLTLDPTWKDRAEKMAEARGLSLSVFVEQLVRAEHERERQAKEERRERREGRS
ncbi:MAG TPA: hypothetical protein VGM56_20995 [Byssovorax sp.]|jgi:hypothetical protein